MTREQRHDRINQAVTEYEKTLSHEQVLVDILTDLMHWSNWETSVYKPVDFDKCLQTASDHYLTDLEEDAQY